MLPLAMIIITAGILATLIALLGLTSGLSAKLLVIFGVGLAFAAGGALLARAAKGSRAATARRLGEVT